MKNELNYIVENKKECKIAELWLLNYSFNTETTISIFISTTGEYYFYYAVKEENGTYRVVKE